MNQPVFILGAHKSGSSLLRSLLDGHPDLFVVPFEAHFFQMAHFWVDYRLRKTRPPMLSLAKTKDEYFKLVEIYNTHQDPSSDANLVGKIDLSRFKAKLANETATFKETIPLYVEAIHEGLYGKELKRDLRIVEKSVEHAEFALDLKNMFPDAKFLYILRNPYANLVALRKHIGRKRYPFLGRILLSLNNSYYHLYRNKRLLNNDYLVIRYEDLVTSPMVTMESVAKFLEIEYLDILLKPTSMGKLWTGNSTRQVQFSSVSSSNLNQWHKDITSLEITYVTKFFRFLLEDYQYDALKPQPLRSLLPCWNEGPLHYIYNRCIHLFM